MANEVFANGREISCKSGDGKSICEFPDVCMTPPTSPATPAGVPVPYPNTGFSRDTTSGSRTVKIDNKEIMLQNQSYYKTSTGDEAGCATPAKKGIITGTIKGKIYFISWSMDVMIENKNAVRHLDMTTHNHASPPANGQVPMVNQEGMSMGIIKIECEPGWTPCQKAQARAKVEEMNKMCPLTRKPGISKEDALGGSLRELGNAFAKGFKSHLKAMLQGKKSRSQWIVPSKKPKGNQSDFMHPCMEKELKNNPNTINKWSADHVKDLQFGGDASGPFKMLDKSVNESLGRQMSKGANIVTKFEHENCN